MNEADRRSTGLHPITPPATMQREATLVTHHSSCSSNCPDEIIDPNRAPRNLIICFDGTGNQYKGDGTETNVLKIFGFLNRDAAHQYHYYQPGIGTYAVRSSLGETDWLTRQRGQVEKGIDLMLGTSLANHVLGGYKFLMRYYAPGDNVYIFGFSRGAYTARFLAEMLDDVGLLPHGNEEMVNFAWDVFTEWQCRKSFDGTKPSEKPEVKKKEVWYTVEGRRMKDNRKAYENQRALGAKLEGFRNKFSRHFDPIRFLGLFDTVNSVPQYENPFMSRASGKKAFPFSARSSAREIWHAVSIDERRIKFKVDLCGQALPVEKQDPCGFTGKGVRERAAAAEVTRLVSATPQASRHLGPTSPISPQDIDRILHGPSKFGQTVHEVWFAGNHCDVGGGWADPKDGALNMSDVPLVWMVRAARNAGVLFDEDKFPEKLREALLRHAKTSTTAVTTTTATTTTNGATTTTAAKSTVETKPVTQPGSKNPTLHDRYVAMLKGTHHDVLKLEWVKYLWMEYLPFKRMELQPKTGTWRPQRVPLSRGNTRDVPDDVPVKVHSSVIERMKANPDYRPRNLLLGGGRGGNPPFLQCWRSKPKVAFDPAHWVPIKDDPYLAAIGDDEFGCVYRKLTEAETAQLERSKMGKKQTEVFEEKSGEVMEKKMTQTSVTAISDN